jgi:hypothetical protein
MTSIRLLPAWTIAAALALASSVHAQAPEPTFSAGPPGDALPAGWQRIALNEKKTPVVYALVDDGGTAVLKADAKSAVSLVMRLTATELARTPLVRWRWKVGAPPPAADNAVARKEDSAARLVFVFDGDRDQLPASDRSVMRIAKSLSGRDLPYATLMYVTAEKAPVGTVIANPHTRRVQMVVASRHADAQGRWLAVERDLDRDFRAAFGEAPGKLIAYGVMSDSDNTESDVQAWYGDIAFAPRR